MGGGDACDGADVGVRFLQHDDVAVGKVQCVQCSAGRYDAQCADGFACLEGLEGQFLIDFVIGDDGQVAFFQLFGHGFLCQ